MSEVNCRMLINEIIRASRQQGQTHLLRQGHLGFWGSLEFWYYLSRSSHSPRLGEASCISFVHSMKNDGFVKSSGTHSNHSMNIGCILVDVFHFSKTIEPLRSRRQLSTTGNQKVFQHPKVWWSWKEWLFNNHPLKMTGILYTTHLPPLCFAMIKSIPFNR